MTSTLDISDLQPWAQEEADYRIMVHCAHAYHHDIKKIMLHATDSGVLVLAIATANVLKECEVWLAFGHSNNLRYIAVHTIAVELGDDRYKGPDCYLCMPFQIVILSHGSAELEKKFFLSLVTLYCLVVFLRLQRQLLMIVWKT